MAVPIITSFTPTSAQHGNLITINGSHFTGTTSVQFGGIAASQFYVISDIYISAIVALGASGSISVTNTDGTGTYTGFTFITSSCDPCTPNQPLIPVCDDPEYCEDIYTDKCIVHNGDYLPNIDASDGDRLNDILLKIDNNLDQAKGNDGVSILSGTGAPSSIGNNNDLYVDLVTGNLYKKISGSWGSPIFTLKGTDGTDGTNGSNGTNGTNGTNGRSTKTYSSSTDPSLTSTIFEGDVWIVI